MLFAAAVAVVAAGLFARIVNFEMRKDEQLYATPTVLLDQYRLYDDVFYNHVPGSAWIFDAVQDVTGAENVLLTARAVVFAFWVLFGAVLTWSTLRLTGSIAVTALICVLLLTNQYLLGPTGITATNNFMPLPLIYLGLVLFILGVRRAEGAAEATAAPAAALVFAAGVCISLATAIKVNAIVFAVAVAIAAFVVGRIDSWTSRFRAVVGPLAAGGTLAAVPVLAVAFRDFERFLAGVLHYNTGPHRAYWRLAVEQDPDVAMSLSGKIVLVHQILFTGANLLLFSALAAVLTVHVAQRGVAGALKRWDWPVYFIAATGILAMLLAFQPTPSFPQYFAQFLVPVALLLVLLFRCLDDEPKKIVTPAMLALALAGGVVGAPRILQDMPTLARPAAWTVNVVHQDGVRIADELRARGLDGPVAALFPMFPLEGGLEVYPEFATGPFAYRVGDIADPELLAQYVTTTPENVHKLLEAKPPAGVLVGFSSGLDSPLLDFVRSEGFEKTDIAIKNRYGDGVLYVRPSPESR
jgi:hypothetical protein